MKLNVTLKLTLSFFFKNLPEDKGGQRRTKEDITSPNLVVPWMPMVDVYVQLRLPNYCIVSKSTAICIYTVDLHLSH